MTAFFRLGYDMVSMRVVLILLFFSPVMCWLPRSLYANDEKYRHLVADWRQMVTVGNIRAGQILSVTPVAAGVCL